jgi:membrane fusion protein (multidrug efflux system)
MAAPWIGKEIAMAAMSYPSTEEPIANGHRSVIGWEPGHLGLGHEPDGPPSPPLRPWVKTLLLSVLLAAAAGAGVIGFRTWKMASAHVSTENAYVTADVIPIAPEVAGRVKRVLVEENQRVTVGQLLAVLDDASCQAAVAQRKADLQAALAQWRAAGASVALTTETGEAQELQAHGRVDQATSAIESARAEQARSGAAVRSAEATARGAVESVSLAEAGIAAADANKERAGAAIQAAQAQIETAQAGVRSVQAAVEAAQAVAERATRDARRYAELFALGAISAQAADQAKYAARAAEAQVESARQQVLAAEAVVTQKQADLEATRRQSQAAEAAIDQARAQRTVVREQAVASQAAIRQAEAQAAASQQAVRQAEARRRQALGELRQARTTPRQVAVSRSSREQAAARIAQARAALQAAQIQLDETRLYAPAAGHISKKTLAAGALVQPGTPMMAIVASDRMWVVANFKETQLVAVRPGQRAAITVDGLPGHRFHGRLESISAGTGATFALLPPDNATGNFTKVVQRIPVKIVLDPRQPEMDRLRVGMSVTATVATQ